MQCKDINECFKEISTYFSNRPTGHFLLINTENYNDYQEIFSRLQADCNIKCVCASEVCFPNELPDVDNLVTAEKGKGRFALIGLSQSLMLQGSTALEAKIGEALSHSISGHGVLLLDHCAQLLQRFISRDIRVEKRVVLVDGNPSELPRIKLVEKNIANCFDSPAIANFRSLLAYLERITEVQIEKQTTLYVVSAFSSNVFKRSMYPISEVDSIYELLIAKHPDLGGATQKTYANDVQWAWLAERMKGLSSFSELVYNDFGSIASLSIHITDVVGGNDQNRKWLLWLALKVFGENNNSYLAYVLNNSQTFDDFEEHLYLDLANIKVEDSVFAGYFSERKKLLKQLPENLPLIAKYCEKLGRHQKNEIFYLTDESDQEKAEFVRCLSLYDYSETELRSAINSMSEALASYMKTFTFDNVNTKLADSDATFRTDLTRYFHQYKLQKLTNRLFPDFVETVNDYAISRPYNKLQTRSSIVSHMDRKNMQLFFFDALGVEYLSFILARCEKYGLVSEVSIGRCELPSITTKNKEFLQYFTEDNWRKIDTLDEIKHHSQIYNYQKCKLPLHIFEELDVIDKELRQIQSMLVQGLIEKAIIVSDHGASRLAVTYGHEVTNTIELDESGEHSGRCCPIEEDPNLPCAAYEDGFSVLANYERFKGGRKANVEVHGGASLEETLIPVIVLSKRPENVEICFVDSMINLNPRVIPELTLYSNIPLQKPRLCINNEFYDGEFVNDKKHAKFSLPKIKRKGDYKAEVYDGDMNLSITLEFKAQKQTREVELF